MKIVALDPSVNNVGWAIYDSTKKDKAAWDWGTWRLTGDNYQKRLDLIVQLMSEEFTDLHILVTEWPQYFHSARGKVAAHQNYTIDLAGICGYVAGRFNLDHRTWHRPTASQWKGSVPKEITQRKFFRVFNANLATTSEHAIDAVMMLQWWLGVLGPVTFRLFQEEWVDNPHILLK